MTRDTRMLSIYMIHYSMSWGDIYGAFGVFGNS